MGYPSRIALIALAACSVLGRSTSLANKITSSSDKWEKQDYRTIHIPVQVAPDAEKKVTYTVKYTW
jgi:hypothetical protein